MQLDERDEDLSQMDSENDDGVEDEILDATEGSPGNPEQQMDDHDVVVSHVEGEEVEQEDQVED